MDETQKRKVSAREYIEEHRRFITLSVVVFFLIFVVLFLVFYVYINWVNDNSPEPTPVQNLPSEISLLPTFNVEQDLQKEEDSFLSGLSFSQIEGLLSGEDNIKSEEDKSSLITIENSPISGFTSYEKRVSIKNYIKIKPKICEAKLSVFTKRDTKGVEVKNLQNMLSSVDGFEEIPKTEILDEKTRESLYVFQKRYAEIIYKKKASKEPTRLIDAETVHFLNLLCGFDTESPDDYVTYESLRYVIKGTGEVYDYDGESGVKSKIENLRTATGTEEAIFSKDANHILLRKQVRGVIQSFIISVRTNGIKRLEDNVLSADINQENKLAYGVANNNTFVIKEYNFDKNENRKIAEIPLTEWEIKYLNPQELLLSFKGTGYAPSIAVVLNTQTGSARQVVRPTFGLAVFPTEVKDFVIYSDGGQGQMNAYLVNTVTGNFGSLGLPTLATKCAKKIFLEGIFCAVPKNLNKNFIYPDDYYKNKGNTEDVLLFKTLTGTTTRVVSFFENKPIDVLDLVLTGTGIFIRDKKDLRLYRLQF